MLLPLGGAALGAALGGVAGGTTGGLVSCRAAENRDSPYYIKYDTHPHPDGYYVKMLNFFATQFTFK